MLNSKCGQNGGHCRSWLGVESYKKPLCICNEIDTWVHKNDFWKNNDQTMMRL
jgi:hypothetical protein